MKRAGAIASPFYYKIGHMIAAWLYYCFNFMELCKE